MCKLCELQALEDELHGLRCRTEELERRLSFGLFRRWRRQTPESLRQGVCGFVCLVGAKPAEILARRLDQELYAGGCAARLATLLRLSRGIE